MPQIITEAGSLSAVDGTGKLYITLITPGWGSSGYYSPKLLEQAAKDRVFGKGTQQHIDHMTAVERHDQPAGSLLTLAAVLTEDAVWEPNWVDEETGTKGRLGAPALLGSRYRDVITEFKDYIGTSISAGADITIGEAEGRKGQIVEKLYPDKLNRVDFVTVAGRGGRVDQVLESIAGRALEVTANDTREAISAAIRDAYQPDGTWVWVLDYDDTNVWFSQESSGESKTWQQGYTMNGAVAELTGDLIEVRRITSYVPIAAAAEAATDSVPIPATATEKKEAAVMATTNIEESELSQLRESASRATALESDITAANTRAVTAEAGLTEANDTAAAAVVESAFTAAGITAPKTAARLSKGYPVKENGVLDTEALAADVAESIAELQVANGAGQVHGVGAPAAIESAVSDADILGALKGGK